MELVIHEDEYGDEWYRVGDIRALAQECLKYSYGHLPDCAGEKSCDCGWNEWVDTLETLKEGKDG